MKIAVLGCKGGVGKTTTALAWPRSLRARANKRWWLTLTPNQIQPASLGTDPSAPGMAALLAGKQPEPIAAADNLYVLPGGPELGGYEVQSADPEDLADAVSSLPYDYILFDCPPGVEYLERLGLVAEEVALVCTNAHHLAVTGASRVMNEIKACQQKAWRVVQQLSNPATH